MAVNVFRINNFNDADNITIDIGMFPMGTMGKNVFFGENISLKREICLIDRIGLETNSIWNLILTSVYLEIRLNGTSRHLPVCPD